jgi:hypothetical protein
MIKLIKHVLDGAMIGLGLLIASVALFVLFAVLFT